MPNYNIKIYKVLKMSSAISTMGPKKIGGWISGITYHMFYNQVSYTIDCEGRNDTYNKRTAIMNAVKEYHLSH